MSSLINTFSPRHMPALFIAFTQAVGGLWPILGNTPKAISEFGLPPRIARSPEAQTAFVAGAGRTTVIGVLVHVLYFQGKYEELDTVLTILGTTLGVVDMYVCWKEGVGRWAAVRLGSGLAIAVWGLLGMTKA